MTIQIKKSKNLVNYTYAIDKLEKKVQRIVNKNNEKELIWFLEHPSIFTGGSNYKRTDIVDKSIKLIKTNRGGKITWHGPGQLICYFAIDLTKRNKDIRKFINIIEKSIIETLHEYKIKSFADRKNVGIWHRLNNKIIKIAAIGIRVKRWVAYHGFSINISNDLNQYNRIIPCGIKDRGICNLINIKKQNYKEIAKVLENKLVNYLKT